MNNDQNQASQPFRITGNWETQSRSLKNKYSQLTDSDLKFESGKENELLTRVETRLNKKREEVINIINSNNSQNGGSNSDRTPH